MFIQVYFRYSGQDKLNHKSKSQIKHMSFYQEFSKNNKELKEFDQTPNNIQVGCYKPIKNLYHLYAIIKLSLGIWYCT